MLMAFALYSGAFSGNGRGVSIVLSLDELRDRDTHRVVGRRLIPARRVGGAAHPDSIAGFAGQRRHLAGYVGGAFNTIRGQGEICFDSLCTLIFLLGRPLLAAEPSPPVDQPERAAAGTRAPKRPLGRCDR